MPEPVDPHHLLLIGAGPGVGAAVVRRFGRESFRSTLISRNETLDQLAPELRSGGLEIEAVGADIEDLDGYRETLKRIFRAPEAPGVVVYNAALPDPGQILDTTVERLRKRPHRLEGRLADRVSVHRRIAGTSADAAEALHRGCLRSPNKIPAKAEFRRGVMSLTIESRR
jgi:NAD(P)-dependent dehydrogenase (short-subunit alcohol dehydrogenase family)